jgi:hypothetical protein
MEIRVQRPQHDSCDIIFVAVNISSWRSAINALQTPDLDRRKTSKKEEEQVNRRRKGAHLPRLSPLQKQFVAILRIQKIRTNPPSFVSIWPTRPFHSRSPYSRAARTGGGCGPHAPRPPPRPKTGFPDCRGGSDPNRSLLREGAAAGPAPSATLAAATCEADRVLHVAYVRS